MVPESSCEFLIPGTIFIHLYDWQVLFAGRYYSQASISDVINCLWIRLIFKPKQVLASNRRAHNGEAQHTHLPCALLDQYR